MVLSLKLFFRPTTLSVEEELAVVDFIEMYCLSGGNLSPALLRLTVKLYQEEQKRQLEESGLVEEAATVHLFETKDGLPSRKWLRGFLKRHKHIKSRWAKYKSRGRVSVTYKDVEEYFNQWIDTSVGVPPQNIVNMDETAMRMCGIKSKVRKFNAVPF